MRHEKAARLLDLARMLAGSAEGLTLDEMARALDVGRRTAERMRDAVWAAFPQMEVVEDPPTRRFRIPAGLDGLFQTPTAEELAALRRDHQYLLRGDVFTEDVIDTWIWYKTEKEIRSAGKLRVEGKSYVMQD